MNDIERKVAEWIGQAVALMEAIKGSRADLESRGASPRSINETATQARRLATNLGKLQAQTDAGRDGADAAESIMAAANGPAQAVYTSPTAEDD